MLLFYNHLFSVHKFKSLNDCPALENNKNLENECVTVAFLWGQKKPQGCGDYRQLLIRCRGYLTILVLFGIDPSQFS